MKLLILATPRSGTRYIVNVLAQAGVRIGHEVMGPSGTVDWKQLWRVAQWDYDRIWHQVRHPLQVISSMVAWTPGWVAGHSEHYGTEDLVETACAYWTQFVEVADEFAHLSYCIEDLELEWPELLQDLALPFMPIVGGQRRHESRPYDTLLWSELGVWEDQVRQLAKEFGYDCSAEESFGS